MLHLRSDSNLVLASAGLLVTKKLRGLELETQRLHPLLKSSQNQPNAPDGHQSTPVAFGGSLQIRQRRLDGFRPENHQHPAIEPR